MVIRRTLLSKLIDIFIKQYEEAHCGDCVPELRLGVSASQRSVVSGAPFPLQLMSAAATFELAKKGPFFFSAEHFPLKGKV